MSIVRRITNAQLRVWRFFKLYSHLLPEAFDALVSMPVAVSRLQGTLFGRDERITLLYVGRQVNYDYLLRTIFAEHREVEYKQSNLLAFRKYMDRMLDRSDVAVLDLGWPYNGLFNRKGGYVAVPDWINMAIEFPEHWEEVVGNFRRTARRHDLRLIRRNGYRCEPVSGRKAIETFYDEMYVPFASHRHAEASAVLPKAHVVKQTMKGTLLHVLRGDEIVAAGVIYPEDNVMFALWMGIPRKFLDSQPEAAISALYYFGIQHAFNNGYEAFDFTGTKPFLRDGVYQFKRRWGAAIDDAFSPNSILIKPRPGNRNAALFCQQVPVLRRTAQGLEALFVRFDEPVGDDTFVRLEKEFGCAGLERMTVIELSDENETNTMLQPGDKCEYRLIRCRLDQFADCYIGRAGD